MNATFKWIAENIKDRVDFVVWTGDSARHDSDEEIPRNANEVLSTNRWVAEKFAEVFSKSDDPKNSLAIPIIPTFGNNDILPHNILVSGPNKWLKTYTDIWSRFIPEEQRHGFERGGWFYVEVIPQKLAVFSLNTLYFFTHNAAVDGCALRSEPGYAHMEWLRIQLHFMRQRGMKAILTGHIPPARTESKQLWDETCWQKYTLWLRQYRDVVIGGLYGHMNIDHFMLHDTKEITVLGGHRSSASRDIIRATMDEELSIQSASDYLEELREDWSDLPNPNLVTNDDEDDDGSSDDTTNGKKSKKDKKKKKASKKIGGPWGERFHTTLVSPSVVPNFFPTLRVIEYNITGLDTSAIWAEPSSWSKSSQSLDLADEDTNRAEGSETGENDSEVSPEDCPESMGKMEKRKGRGRKGKTGKKRKKKPSNPDLIVPFPPSKGAPPGPAYSPQPLTLLGYTQYFANLTDINNDNFVEHDDLEGYQHDTDARRWHEGKHKGKHPKDKIPRPKAFQFQVEYDTFTDPIYKLKDMTVRSYIKLAHRIGQYKSEKGPLTDITKEDESVNSIEENGDYLQLEAYFDQGDDADDYDDMYLDSEKHKKKHRKNKHHSRNEKNKIWLRFIERAFVGTLDEKELQSFDRQSAAETNIPTTPPSATPTEMRNEEL